MSKDIKDIVRDAIMKVRNGTANDHDMAIYTLLEQNKSLREHIRELEENGGVEGSPEYKKKPWYME